MILNKYFNGITYLILLGISIRLIVVIVNYLTGYNSFIGPDSYGLHHTAVMLSKKDFSFIISQKFHLHNFYLFFLKHFLHLFQKKAFHYYLLRIDFSHLYLLSVL